MSENSAKPQPDAPGTPDLVRSEPRQLLSPHPLPRAPVKKCELEPPLLADPLLKILAYARLDFDNFTFYVQTLQVVLGRKLNEAFQLSHHDVDVHLSLEKGILRRHAKIFYNFGSQRFELSISGRNGAFVDDAFIEKDMLVPLKDGTKIQIGNIAFLFILPLLDDEADKKATAVKPFGPTEAINLRTNLMSLVLPTKADKTDKVKQEPGIDKRRLSRLKRRRSLRRRSLATTAGNEIDDILKELGVDLVDAIEASIANGEIGNGDIEALLDAPVFEDDLEPELEGLDLDLIDMDLHQVNQEIADLAPLIDAHNQDLLAEKEERRRQLEQKRLLVLAGSRMPPPPPRGFKDRMRPQLAVTVLAVAAELLPMRYKPLLRAISVSVDPPLVNYGVPILDDEPLTRPKVPKPPKPAQPKPQYNLEDIPEAHRIKPLLTNAQLISQALKGHKHGLALLQILELIKDAHPFFRYCSEPWQFCVSHAVRNNKMFSRVKAPNDEWVYTLDQRFIDERELVRRKQQEMLAMRTRDAASRADEMKRYGGYNSSYSPGYNLGATSYGSGPRPPVVARQSASPLPSIKEQLASNRSLPPAAALPKLPMNADTKKTLAYLQNELLTLYKARKLSFNKETTTEIITKALATTMAQVNAIGAKSGCGDNALNFLVEKAPQQVSKILDIALSKSIKDMEAAKATPAKPNYNNLSRPPSFMGKPGAFSRPGSGGGLGGLSRPPQFLLNKPDKRSHDGDDPARKVIKLDD